MTVARADSNILQELFQKKGVFWYRQNTAPYSLDLSNTEGRERDLIIP